jgi:hemerythrin-like domain-containing protein
MSELFHHGEQPDCDLMLDIFYYMTHYPDRFHHPKEDFAFARVMRPQESVGIIVALP